MVLPPLPLIQLYAISLVILDSSFAIVTILDRYCNFITANDFISY